MKYCKNCLTTDLRPNALFTNGICIACQFGSDSKSNRLERELWLNEISENIRRKRRLARRPTFDCIVGISGGKDSLRQALWARDKLDIIPLLVCVGYPPLQMSDTGAENLENIIRHGFDLINLQPAPNTSMMLTKQSFLQFGNLCKSTELALHTGVPALALKKGIRTILWGENPALQVGDSNVVGISPIDGSNHRNLNTLTDGGLGWIDLPQVKKDWYTYPAADEFLKRRVEMYYLGPIWEDWGARTNATYSALNGLTLSKHSAKYTGDILRASMLDEDFTNINMMLKYYKFGFGRATDYVNEMLRGKELSRKDAIDLVAEYDGVCSDEIISIFCQYISLDVPDFWKVVYRYVNKDIFELKPGSLRPIPKFTVGKNISV